MKLMKKKTRKKLNKMMQKGFEPTGFFTGAVTALAVTAAMRSKPMQNVEHKIGEKLGEAWPKISDGITGMTSAANGLLSKLHLTGQNGHEKREMREKSGMKGQSMGEEELESFSAPLPRATRPGRSSKKGSKE